MENKLFRKESVDHISSPEQLHDYMRVTSPRLWMILSAILALLVGLIGYAFTTTMETAIHVKATVSGNYIEIDLPAESLETVKIRMPVRIEGKNGYISNIFQVSRLRLEISFDGNTVLEDGYYEMIFEDGRTLPEELKDTDHFLSVNNGVVTVYDDSKELANFLSTDRRVRVDGNLATVRGAGPYDLAMMDVTMDEGTQLPDGTYDAEIITESTTPMSFLLN